MSNGFYRAFEEKYRGSPELIKSRLRAYLPFVEPLAELDRDAQTIDLGCGRGEWVELMTEVGFKSHGVDLDEYMLRACTELGLSVEKGDAITFLAALPDGSQAIVSAFHFVEHISFEQLQTVVSEALRVLKPGGLLIMETPNPENIVVGTCNFYLDPTHQHPIPPQLLSFLPEYQGFARTKIVRLQEPQNLMQSTTLTLHDVLSSVSPDYAVIAQKAATANIFHLIDPAFEHEYGLSLATLANLYNIQIEKKTEAIRARAEEAEAKAEEAGAKAEEAGTKADDAEAYIRQLHQTLHNVVNSWSWRITTPLRWCRPQIIAVAHRLGLYESLRWVYRRLPDLSRPSELDQLTDLSTRPPRAEKILYVDISHLVQKDLKTGIQRVTRSIVSSLLKYPPENYRIKPVYATTTSHGYLHATRFTQQLTDVYAHDPEKEQDSPIDPRPGDIFLGLDFVAGVVVGQQRYLKWIHAQGVRVYFLVYDLLPIKLAHYFPEGSENGHREWLEVITNFDGAICISRAVKDDLDTWLKTRSSRTHELFETNWFHLGADVENSAPSKGVPENAEAVTRKLAARPSFLMVGTLEPRKGHLQTLQAFELLWEQGVQVNLIIVGNQGWMVDGLLKRLQKHPELNNRLFWLQGTSDEYLERLYAVSTCLIAASEAEGFGLPLIEAARHKLPIIARDIAEFREVSGSSAYYFSGIEPISLASTIELWLSEYAKGEEPKSETMSWLTWNQSTAQLISRILPN